MSKEALMLRQGLARAGLPESVAVRDVPLRVAPSSLQRAWRGDVAAMTLPWVIYLSPSAFVRARAGEAGRLLAHESTHLDQWRRLGVVRFGLRYGWDYARGRMAGLPHHTAYRAISLEREARAMAEATVDPDR